MANGPPDSPAISVIVYEARCCGSGNCALTAPNVFDQRDDDGVVVVLDPAPPPSQHGLVREAVGRCPTSALGIVER